MPAPVKPPPPVTGASQRLVLMALLAGGFLVQLGVLAHRLSGRIVEPTPAEPPPLPVVASRPSYRPAVERDNYPVLAPEPALPASRSAASLPDEAAAPGPVPAADPGLGLPPELMPSPVFVAQVRQARAAGADLWLLAHVSDTQFQRQLAALRRVAPTGATTLDPNQARQQFLEATAGADALRRLLVADWARHRLDGGAMSVAQAEALYELDAAFAAQSRELQRAMSAKEIDAATYGRRQAELRQKLEQARTQTLGQPHNNAAGGREVTP